MYHPVHALVPLLVYSRCQRGVTQGAVCLNSCPRPCKNRFELQPIGGRSDWCTAVILVLLKKHGQIILLEGSRAEPGCLGHAGARFLSGRSGVGVHLVLHFDSGAIRAFRGSLCHMHRNIHAIFLGKHKRVDPGEFL